MWGDYHMSSADELYALWANIGPGNAHGIGDIISYGSMNSSSKFFASSQSNSIPATHVLALKWSNGSIVDVGKSIGYSTIPTLYRGNFGCTNNTAPNYDPTASWDDGSCFPYAVGDAYQGGYIFYLDGNGGGLIASYDQINDVHWGCEGELVSGASGFAIGTGYQNTQDILTHQNVNGSSCGAPFNFSNPSAAQACDNYSITENGVTYDDWYLPSREELQFLLANLPIGQGYLISTNPYWSSTQHDADNAWIRQNLLTATTTKTSAHLVRAIRSF